MKRPQFTDPYEAARVSTFMEPAELGRWRRKSFTITEHMAVRMHLQAVAEGGPNMQMRIARTVPPGKYMTLLRKATPGELEDIESGDLVDALSPDAGDERYVPIMSDTPSEINEHSEVIEEASGDVLITGLGLGVIVSALLAKPDVRTITVVEIDKDVIALTGPYYADEPRVTIINADALKAAEMLEDEGQHFDYAWHDIWSYISEGNLSDDTRAEHGISYHTMFDAYAEIADTQSAWAYHEAVALLAARDRESEELQAWVDALIDPEATYERRLRLLVIWHAHQLIAQLPLDTDMPDDMYSFIFHEMKVGPSVVAQIEARGGHEAMAREIAAGAKDGVIELTSHARPNEHPEANVA